RIDSDLLSRLLGVPVTRTVAVRNQGIAAIGKSLALARAGTIDDQLRELLAPSLKQGISQGHSLLILEGDETSATDCGLTPGQLRAEIYRSRRQKVNAIVPQVVTVTHGTHALSVTLGRLLLHPLYGSVIAVAVCYLIFYQLLGVFIAGSVVDFTEKQGMRVFYEPVIRRAAATVLPADVAVGDTVFQFPAGTALAGSHAANFDHALSQAPLKQVKYNFWAHPGPTALIGQVLAGEYGVLTLTVTYLVGLLMPLV